MKLQLATIQLFSWISSSQDLDSDPEHFTDLAKNPLPAVHDSEK
jgi:hypothetical protein